MKTKKRPFNNRSILFVFFITLLIIGGVLYYQTVYINTCRNFKTIIKKIEPDQFAEGGSGYYTTKKCSGEKAYDATYSLASSRTDIINHIQSNAKKANFTANGSPSIYPKPLDPNHPEDSYVVMNYKTEYHGQNFQIGLWIYPGNQGIDGGSTVNVELNKY